MKKISVLIPCYNEQENVEAISKAVLETLTRDLPQYDYELVFIDNDSTDDTRPILRSLCAENPKIKAIFNARKVGESFVFDGDQVAIDSGDVTYESLCGQCYLAAGGRLPDR